MLQQMRETLQKSEQFEVTLRTYSQGYFSGGNRTSELKKATSELKLIWARPMRLRVEILKTSNPVSEGAILTTEDMINCRLRAKGVLGLFPLTVAATDPKLANNRNHTLPATHPAATLTRITRPGATWTYLKEGSVEGTPVKIVEVSGVERLDHEVTREVIGVDTKTWTVRRLVQYVGDTKVGEHTMLDFQPAPVITPQTFQL